MGVAFEEGANPTPVNARTVPDHREVGRLTKSLPHNLLVLARAGLCLQALSEFQTLDVNDGALGLRGSLHCADEALEPRFHVRSFLGRRAEGIDLDRPPRLDDLVSRGP